MWRHQTVQNRNFLVLLLYIDIFLLQIYEAAYNNGLRQWWLGATDEGSEGTFSWSNSRKAISFTKWKRGEPNNVGTNGEDCIEVSGGNWNDAECDVALRFICQIDPETSEEDIWNNF